MVDLANMDLPLREPRAVAKARGRPFGAEEAPKKPGHRWSVSRQRIETGYGPPRSQPEPRVPLRPDAIDRTVRLTARAPVRQAKPG
jgi:hypothetical protein